MRVLLLGATGNLGSRLIPSLLSHGHVVTAYVRNAAKLTSLLNSSLLAAITVLEGDAKNVKAMHSAIVKHDCDALICAAGMVVVNPWGQATLPGISEAAADAAISAAKERGGNALRCWCLAGMSLLDLPDSTYFLADYVPVGREHIQTLKMLPTKPVNLIEWSILCPSVMKPAFATQELKILEQPRKREFMMKADVPPELTNPLYGKLPLVGGYLSTFNTMVNHVTTLEENADFMAEDLASGSQQWIFRRVGVKAVLSK